MKRYEKPIITIDTTVAEGVYAASGSSACYTIDAYIHQRPEEGRGDYRIQIDAHHSENADHTTNEQTITLVFNQSNVEFVSCPIGTLASQTGNSITITCRYHQNPNDNIGTGDFIVKADQGLEITDKYITDGF